MTEKEERTLKPVYLIVGDDYPKIELALKRLKARVTAQTGSDINIDEFDASESAALVVVNAANTLAFMGGIRLVLVRQVEAWSKEDKKVVAGYLESPNREACLALVAEKLPAQDPLRAAVLHHGQILEYPAPKASQLPSWLAREAARRYGLALGEEEARLITDRAGNDLGTLLREVEKLRAYAGGKRVTAMDVRAVVSTAPQARIFDLVDALMAGDAKGVFVTARELLAGDMEPLSLLAPLANHFQALSRVAALQEAGADVPVIQDELKMNQYRLHKLLEQLKGLTGEEIGACLDVITEAEARMKGMGSLPPEIELELCLGRLLRLTKTGKVQRLSQRTKARI